MKMIEGANTPNGRDLRLDMFRGLANWAIFVDHIPNNVVAWLTLRNYGFSDAADLFVFVSGYTAAFVFARVMLKRGFFAGALRLLRRVWQIYVAHILLFLAYAVSIAYVAQNYDHSHLLDEFNVRFLIEQPIETLKHTLLLEFKPLNMDVLPLYVVLMAAFPPILFFMLSFANAALMLSFTMYVIAVGFGLNLNSYPSGAWYFNPFAWQFLFVVGAWFALKGTAEIKHRTVSNSALVIALAFLALSLIVTLSSRLQVAVLPSWLTEVFTPNDKTNLAWYRVVHFLCLALLVVRFLPATSPALKLPVFLPLILCGQRSLEVFCAGIFLSFVAHFLIELVFGSVVFQILVSVAGFGLMTCVAYWKTWVKQADVR
jgi:hypothetical protein